MLRFDPAALGTFLPEGGVSIATLAVGGFVNHRKPLALLRAVAEFAPKLQPTSLVILSASLDLDLALALWPSITTVHCPFTGIEGHAAVSPHFKARYLAGALDVPAWDTGLLMQALATDPDEARNTSTGLGTDLPALNPWLSQRDGQVWVRGLGIDLALVHCPRGTRTGGGVWYDSPWGDALLWERAEWVVGSFPDALWGDAVPRNWTECRATKQSMIVSFHRGTWPTADPNRVGVDEDALADYVRTISASPERGSVIAWHLAHEQSA